MPQQQATAVPPHEQLRRMAEHMLVYGRRYGYNVSDLTAMLQLANRCIMPQHDEQYEYSGSGGTASSAAVNSARSLRSLPPG